MISPFSFSNNAPPHSKRVTHCFDYFHNFPNHHRGLVLPHPVGVVLVSTSPVSNHRNKLRETRTKIKEYLLYFHVFIYLIELTNLIPYNGQKAIKATGAPCESRRLFL